MRRLAEQRGGDRRDVHARVGFVASFLGLGTFEQVAFYLDLTEPKPARLRSLLARQLERGAKPGGTQAQGWIAGLDCFALAREGRFHLTRCGHQG